MKICIRIYTEEEENGEGTNPRPILTEIEGKSPQPPRDLKIPINLPGTVGGGLGDGGEPPGDRESAVDALCRLLRLVNQLLEAVVGAPQGVPPDLAGGHALGEAVEVAAPEGPHGPHRAARYGGFTGLVQP